MQNIPLLSTAIVSITLALVFYTIGTWGEHLQKILKKWHILFFVLGLIADSTGTSIMSDIVKETGSSEVLHAVTGLLALILMAVHAAWAIWTYWRGSEKAKRKFSKFSVLVWAFWLIPYIIGAYLGSSH